VAQRYERGVGRAQLCSLRSCPEALFNWLDLVRHWLQAEHFGVRTGRQPRRLGSPGIRLAFWGMIHQ
jgi:hypothetical protein